MQGVLGIDTAGPVIGVAFFHPQMSASWEMRIVRGADTQLAPAVADFIARYSIGWVAVSVGPGAFTSLRVGVSTALGVALSKNLQVIPVSSLAARAGLIRQGRSLALLDARKKRVYGQLFDAEPELPLPLGEPVDVSLESVLPEGEFWAVGEGAIHYKEQIIAAGGKVAIDADRSPALEVARLGWLQREKAISPIDIQLFYLRAPDATRPKNLGIPLGSPKLTN